MGETNSPQVAHVGYDISPLSRVKFKIVTTCLTACVLNLLIPKSILFLSFHFTSFANTLVKWWSLYYPAIN
jgi:hypothetical protein